MLSGPYGFISNECVFFLQVLSFIGARTSFPKIIVSFARKIIMPPLNSPYAHAIGAPNRARARELFARSEGKVFVRRINSPKG